MRRNSWTGLCRKSEACSILEWTEELGEPSSEVVVAHALSGQPVTWSLKTHRGVLNTYLRRRAATNGLRFPRLFEVALTLELAERLRGLGDMDGCREVVTLAVENHPGHTGLLTAEAKIVPDVPISWRDIMLPPVEAPQQQSPST